MSATTLAPAPAPDLVSGAGTRPRGIDLLFAALDHADHDPRTVASATVNQARTDLARLGQQHATDGRFLTGIAWGHAALGLVHRALDGETDPARLSFTQLRRTA